MPGDDGDEEDHDDVDDVGKRKERHENERARSPTEVCNSRAREPRCWTNVSSGRWVIQEVVTVIEQRTTAEPADAAGESKVVVSQKGKSGAGWRGRPVQRRRRVGRRNGWRRGGLSRPREGEKPLRSVTMVISRKHRPIRVDRSVRPLTIRLLAGSSLPLRLSLHADRRYLAYSAARTSCYFPLFMTVGFPPFITFVVGTYFHEPAGTRT